MKIICLGDSLMQENGPETHPQEGWPQELHYFLQNPLIPVLDLALNGRSTKSFIDEGHLDEALEKAQEGDVVFISFGHNDEKKEDPKRYTDPYGGYQSNLALMNGKFQEKGCKAFFFTSMTRLHYDEKGVLLHTHGDYPLAMKEVAKRLGVTCFDLEKLSYDFLAPSSFETNCGYYMVFEPNLYPHYPEGLHDTSHLSVKGAKLVSRLLWGEMKKNPVLESLFL
jgi:lysophospholipase L1-like esterase